jgi:hypothetical protein
MLVAGWVAVHRADVVRRHLHLVLGVEAFSSGRVNADGRLAVQLFNRDLETGAVTQEGGDTAISKTRQGRLELLSHRPQPHPAALHLLSHH